MRRALFASIAAALLLTCSRVQADDFVLSRFADYIESLRIQVGLPGVAVAVVGRTDILWEAGFGYQNVEKAVRMRPDTPIHVDGLTQTVTAAYMLRCTEEGYLSLDDPIGAYVADVPEPAATFRQLLSHTFPTTSGLQFLYRPERVDALADVIRRCQGSSYRATLAYMFDRLAMINSVPGGDVLSVLPPDSPDAPDSEREHYAAVLQRLATPYAVDAQKRPTPFAYSATTITPSTGLITTVEDYAHFDLEVRSGRFVLPDTLAEAWRNPADAGGKPLPHGLGWFVQTYNGDKVVWQYGSGGDAGGSSSMVISLPARGLTLVMAANSTGLTKAFSLDKGDITTSPFARVFLSLFTR
jgi:CubicO group peptidase (beta-lactamase class C family)